ncbi:UNVERIFIED_CONTAM: hypothetical protein FKN15_000032 [Acipenser sinensis]
MALVQCSTLSMALVQCDALSMALVQCDALSMALVKCDALSMALVQCDALSMALVQCDALSVALVQCDAFSVALVQCDDLSMALVQCSTLSMALVQCDALSMALVQCDALSMALVQCDALSMALVQCDALSMALKFQFQCSKNSLLQEFGDRIVRLSTANTYSYTKVDVPFQEFVEHLLRPQSLDVLGSDTLYFFGDNNFTEWRSLFQNYVPPPYTLPGTSGAYSFGIAGPGTGVPFHWHGPGYSEVIYGRKRWFLYPPEKAPNFHPNKTTLSWVVDTYPSLNQGDRPIECTIHPGEFFWWVEFAVV